MKNTLLYVTCNCMFSLKAGKEEAGPPSISLFDDISVALLLGVQTSHTRFLRSISSQSLAYR
jgi:hypothetical protein